MFLAAIPIGQLVFCATETFLNPESSDALLFVPGYNIYRKARSESRGECREGGGLISYVPSSLKSERRVDMEMSFDKLEVMIVEIKPKKKNSLLLVVIYRPPKTSAEDTRKLLMNLEELIQ